MEDINGEFFETIKSQIGHYDNVVMPGWINRPQIKFLAELSSASLVPFKNIENFQNNTPNKIVDSLIEKLFNDDEEYTTNQLKDLFWQEYTEFSTKVGQGIPLWLPKGRLGMRGFPFP